MNKELYSKYGGKIMIKKDDRFAVLIDAENVPYSNISGILREIAKYGTPTVKRIYGDFTKQASSGWKSHLLEHAITPVQQYSYTTGKNASDSTLIIDAMDLLYEGHVNAFCIVSSDSDYTRLAIRIRESSKRVFGIGEHKTPTAFIASCDKFIYIENIDVVSPQSNVSDKQAPSIGNDILKLISESVNDLADDNGYVFMGDLGNLIIKKKPDFDPRSFGYHQLTSLMKSLDGYEIDERRVPDSNIKHVFIRTRR